MGTWGTGIFSDDLAADIRGDWRDAIIDGEDPAAVTRRLIELYRPDHERQVVFWLALAAAQMESGRLDPDVRDRALAVIDSGDDVARWRAQGEGLARQRENVLARLAEKLRAPQPKPKRLRRSAPAALPFDVGDAVRLRGENGLTDVYAIVVTNQDGYPRGTVDPVVELVIWQRERSPTSSELAQLPCVSTRVGRRGATEEPGFTVDGTVEAGGLRPRMFVLTTPTKKDRFGPHVGELIAHGVPRPPSGDPSDGAAVSGSVLTSWTTWSGLTRIITWEDFQRDVELTRR